MYQSEQAGWHQPSLHHSEGSWQQGSSEQWHHGNFDKYQQHYEEVSSGHQRGRMSFSARGDHDQQMDHSHLNTRLTTIEEMQQDIRNTLHQHAQWQAEMGGAIMNIQHNQ